MNVFKNMICPFALIVVVFAFFVTSTVNAQSPTSDVTVGANTVIVMTYGTAPNPDLTKSDFKISGGYPLPANATLTKNADGTVWTLTLPGITDLDDVNPFRLKGYLQSTLVVGANAAFEGHNNAPHLQAGGYAIIATYRSSDGTKVDGGGQNLGANIDHPTLPSYSNNPIVRRDWDDHFDAAAEGDIMPDLWEHFQLNQRGTINLIVVNDPDGDENDEANRYGPVDSRSVIISEVMWARDTSQFGESGYTREQWIEIYNTTDDFILFRNIRFTLSNVRGEAKNIATDRFSNAVDRVNHWDITDKGQDGSTGQPAKEFVSMYRAKSEGTAGAGWLAGAWARSSDANVYSTLYRGSPGRPHTSVNTAPKSRKLPAKDVPNKNRIIINEIANLSGQNDWIELGNNSGSSQSLNGWTLSIVKSLDEQQVDNEQEIVRFPNISIPAGGVLLLVNEDPISSLLAAGYDVKITDPLAQIRGADANISYLVVKGETNHGFEGKPIDIPNNNDWLLILRSGQPWLPNNANRDLYNTGHNIEDVAGPGAFKLETIRLDIPLYEKKADGSDGSDGPTTGDIWQTTVFPLNGRDETGNKLLKYNYDLDEGTVHVRNVNKHGFEVESFTRAPFTGIGYDRNVPNSPAYAGTPGYPNGVATARLSNLAGGKLVISEIMLTTLGRFPQWIELHNTSKTRGIRLNDPDGTGNLKPWKIVFENHDSGSWFDKTRNLNIEFNLSDWFEYIPPNQTVLIASYRSSSNSDYFPNSRVADVFTTKRNAFSMENRRDPILNAEGGFYIKIVDSSGATSDEIGNLDGLAPNTRAGIGYDDPVGFQWPIDLTEKGYRSSLIRLKDANGTYRRAVPTRDRTGAATNARGAVIPLGKQAKRGDYIDHAWTHAANTKRSLARETYYGQEDDIGTPLHTSGTPLPVTLSLFRPVSENGNQVVIHWTTESEIDNAGFNILRSPTRDGHFKRINAELIQGAGSTAERQTYKWIDTTAKPGVVYYYQIEDVSLAGEKQTLATTKLKGFVSAKNKLTTQWGTLKAQD